MSERVVIVEVMGDSNDFSLMALEDTPSDLQQDHEHCIVCVISDRNLYGLNAIL
jgi:hypothetical protein